MDENPKTIMTGFAPLDFVVAMVSPSITESIISSWDGPVYELAEKAKDRGIAGINSFLQTSAGKDKRYIYSIKLISQETLNKCLRGEFKTLEELMNFQSELRSKVNVYQYEETLNYALFCHEEKDEETYKTIEIIDTVFFNIQK